MRIWDLQLKIMQYPWIEYPSDIKLVLCLTDGSCNDVKLVKEVCRALRGKVEVIGILLYSDKVTEKYVEDMFGEDR